MHRKDMIQMIAVIAVLVIGFFVVQAYIMPKSKPAPVNTTSTAGNKAASNTPATNRPDPPKIEDNTPSTDVTSKPTDGDKARGFIPMKREQAYQHKLANSRMTAQISERGAVIESLVFIDADGKTIFKASPDDPVNEPEIPLELLRPLKSAPDLSTLALVLDDNDNWRNTSRWELVSDAPKPEHGQSLTFRFPPSSGQQFDRESDGTIIFKTITLLPDSYRFDVSVRIENKGSAAVEKVVGLWGPVGMTNDAARNSAMHSRIALYGSTDSKRFVQFEDSPALRSIASDVTSLNEDFEEEGRAVHDWVPARDLDDVDQEDRFLVVHGLRTDYFLAFIAADPESRDSRWSGQVLPLKGDKDNAALSLIAPKQDIAPGESAVINVRFYAGPRDKDDLKAAWMANPPADEDIKVQWAELSTSGFWDIIASPLVWILGMLSGLVGPGFAIILLTLLVRLSLSPLSYRGQKSMATYTQKMKVVKPKLDAIKEKYSGRKDQQSQLKMLTETRAAMKEQNVGMLPLGGCMPMLIQLPIFIGLYRAFGNAIFLRQAEFLWIHDLSLPDASLPFSTYIGDGWLSFLAHNGYLTFNVLPMLWIILSVLQFKLQPKSEDPQQAAMQKNMAFIFPLMGLMFYGYASGFSFYFIISSIYSIAESKLVKRNLVKQGIVPDPKLKPKVDDETKPDYHGAS